MDVDVGAWRFDDVVPHCRSQKLHVTGDSNGPGLARLPVRMPQGPVAQAPWPAAQPARVACPCPHTVHCTGRTLRFCLFILRFSLDFLDLHKRAGRMLGAMSANSPSHPVPDIASTAHHPVDGEAEPQPCQDKPAHHPGPNMKPEERAYHERFMREAINMVNHPSPQLVYLQRSLIQ